MENLEKKSTEMNNHGPSEAEKVLGSLPDFNDFKAQTKTEQKALEALFCGDPITVSGRNMGTIENARFRKISEHFSNYPAEDLENITALEEEYLKNYELANESHVTPLPIDENNKVIIKPGQLYTKIDPYSNIDVLRNYARCGVVASEWFGVLESEGEGRYCAFLEETIDDDTAKAQPFMHNFNAQAKLSIQLFFDMDNPVLQKLVKQDFFNYKIKKQEGDIEDGAYEDKMRRVLDELILPNSPCMETKSLKNPGLPYHYWKAIPGGIPPQLINGIRINLEKNPNLQDKISEIVKLFPNATIFDKEDNVLTT